MQTTALVNLTPSSVNLDNLYVPTQGAGNNGWVFLPEASSWSFAVVWNAGNPGVGPGGSFVVQGTNDAVAKPLDTAVNPVADANLNIFMLFDDMGVEMTVPAGGVAGSKLFFKQRPAPARWGRLNYIGGGGGCTAQITSLVFHAVGLRDA
jgi:hypothetical protein